MVAESVPGGMRLRAACPAAQSAIATNAPPCAMPACCDTAGDNGSSISTTPGETRVRYAPIVFINPVLAKLARMRASNSGSLGVGPFKRCCPHRQLMTTAQSYHPIASEHGGLWCWQSSGYGPLADIPLTRAMSAFGGIADMGWCSANVCLWPKADFQKRNYLCELHHTLKVPAPVKLAST